MLRFNHIIDLIQYYWLISSRIAFLTANLFWGLTNDFFLRSSQLLFRCNFVHFRCNFVFPVFFWKSSFVQNFQFSPYHYHSLPLPFITLHYPSLPFITLHYPALPCITLHHPATFITLHYPLNIIIFSLTLFAVC